MPAKPAVEVVGLGRVIRQIKSVEPELVEELKGANREIADSVAGTARGFARVETGRMRGTIRPGATARTGIVRAGSARVPWAGPQHFGWAAKNISPDPFLYDALDARRGEVEEAYLAAITAICRKLDP